MIDRRTIMKWTISIMGARLYARTAAHGKSTPFPRRFLHIHLSGGADPTQFCAPAEGYVSGYDPARATAIGTNSSGRPFAVPPINHWQTEHQKEYGHLMPLFFNRYGSQTLQFDGVVSEFPVHEFANKELHLGASGRAGFPNLVSLVAHAQHQGGSSARVLPAMFQSFPATAGLVEAFEVPAPSSSGALETLLAFGAAQTPTITARHRNLLAERLQARAERLQKQNLALGEAALKYSSHLAKTGVFEQLNTRYGALRTDGLGHESAVVLAGFIEDQTLCANLSLGGFDSHGNHFEAHPYALGVAFNEILRILSVLEKHDLLSSTTVLISTEFGRTPFYGGRANPRPLNGSAGKDHGTTGSFFLVGAGITRAGRFGGYDAWLEPLPVNPLTLEPASGGVVMRLPDLHQAIRASFGVPDGVAETFPLNVSRAFDLLKGPA